MVQSWYIPYHIYITEMNTRTPKYYSSLEKGGNILAKAKKLTIEVPEDGQEASASKRGKLKTPIKSGKNSPSRAQGSVKFPKLPLIPPGVKKSVVKKVTRISQSANSTPKNLTPKNFKFITLNNAAIKHTEVHKSPLEYVFQTKINNLITKSTRNSYKASSRRSSKSSTRATRKSKTPSAKECKEFTVHLNAEPVTTAKVVEYQKHGDHYDRVPSNALESFVTQVSNPKLSQKIKNEQEMTDIEIQARSELLYREHLFQTFQAFKFIKTIPPSDLAVIRAKKVSLTRRDGYEGKKTLIFDLDETLVHCCEDVDISDPDVILPITFPGGEVIHAGINIRPYAIECLKQANKYFEVLVFTASHKCYADVVLDYLDPTGELIHHRLYRDNCIQVQGVYIKDLRIINRKLKHMLIVDNAAYSFAYQIDNGIPIISWHNDYHDKELFNLMEYLKGIATVEDIREINRQTFHLNTFYEDYLQEYCSAEDQELTSLTTSNKRHKSRKRVN
jgi:Dullard-like phosphatase family protein